MVSGHGIVDPFADIHGVVADTFKVFRNHHEQYRLVGV